MADPANAPADDSSDNSDARPPPPPREASGDDARRSAPDHPRSKDFWDKASTISGVLSSILIASFGLYFNHTAGQNQRKLDELLGARQHEIASNQNRLRELEVVESLLPHLASNETTEGRKKLALLAIRHLGNEMLATEFAEVLGGEGAEAALTHIATTATSEAEREMAQSALVRLKMGAGKDLENPDLDAIISSLNSLEGGTDHFAILHRSDQVYIQTIGGPEEFQLEYRDGAADKHFQCMATKRVVIDAFRSYASPGDEAWRTACDWKKLHLR